MCNNDCWNCELEGCPYTLEISEEMNESIKKNMTYRERQLLYRKLYIRTEKGREVNRQGQRTYKEKHPQKYNKDHAKFEWIKANTKRNGVRPTDKEIIEWGLRYDERLKRKTERQKEKTG